MDLSSPISSVVPSLHGPVLAVLARAPRAMSGREVARNLHGRGSDRGVLYVLEHLVSHGVVHREDHPPAALFRLNRDHVAAGAITELADLKAVLMQRLRDAVASWEVPPLSVLLFGSAARGEGGPASDIDIVIVAPEQRDDDTWGSQLADLSEKVLAWTGNPASIVEFRLEDLRPGGSGRSALVEEVLHEGVRIHGPKLVDIAANHMD